MLEDAELRDTYGRLIGRIAYSHWWPIEDIVADAVLNKKIGAFPEGPGEWTVHPIVLAIILRATDACQLDARRAPGFLRSLRKPTGLADLHWRAQGYLQKPVVKQYRLEFTSAKPVPVADREAWWIGYELLKLADCELGNAEAVLSDMGLATFAVHRVAGVATASQLAKYIPTEGWFPVDTSLRSTDVASLVKRLGGEGLYGSNPAMAIRELIQNARDAVAAARVKTDRDASWGEIIVRLVSDGTANRLDVEDNGLGMSKELLSGSFLDFGASYWDSHLCSKEHPGLLARGFQPQGVFGVGFFSVFMLGDKVRVVTRRPEDAIGGTRVLEFEEGLTSRPILREATTREQRVEPGTCVSVWLRETPDSPRGILKPHNTTSIYPGQPLPQRKVAWRLSELCLWLCPALDVDLLSDSNGTIDDVVKASDWQTISGSELMHRLMLDRGDCADPITLAAISSVVPNIREVRNPQGDIIGRAALVNWSDAIAKPGGGLTRVPGVITAGSFRSVTSVFYPGLLIGRPTIVSRSQASPVAFDHPVEIAHWATQQATLVERLTADVGELAKYAQLVRLLNGDTGSLPIVERAGRILSFCEISSLADLPDEIELFDANWLVEPEKIGQHDQSATAIGVSSGRMRPGYDGPKLQSDFRERANHPRWQQYWMSLWGATIEAIAAAWGCRLQSVLEASTIHKKGREETEKDGRRVHRQLRDIIRRPQ